MTRLEPLSFAGALTTTVIVAAIATCAAVIVPFSTVDFLAAWLPGLDLSLLQPPGGQPVRLAVFAYGVLGLGLVTFSAGFLFARIYNSLARSERAHVQRRMVSLD